MEKAAVIAEKNLKQDELHVCSSKKQYVKGGKVFECVKLASYFEDGQWWCGWHAPSVLGKRAEQRREYCRKKHGGTPVTVVAVPPAEVAAEPKSNGHESDFNYASKKGNIMSQMGRLGRGEVELKAAQKEVRDIKHKRDATDDALKGLAIIKNGQKDIVEKVLASVR